MAAGRGLRPTPRTFDATRPATCQIVRLIRCNQWRSEGPHPDRARKKWFGERCFSSPVFSDGALFLRGEKHLFKIAAK